MKFRIAIWAGIGAVVVVLWTFYISATAPTPLGSLWTLVCVTCPIALARRYPLSIYFVTFVNAATYALIGTVVETMRQHKGRSLISN